MIDNMRKRVYDILEMQDSSSRYSIAVNGFIMSLIILNVIAVILESVRPYYLAYHSAFLYFELFSISIFTIEYLCRVWVSIEKQGGDNSWIKRLRYMRTPMAIIDLLAIAPFYLSMIFSIDMRILRILRLLRIFKLTRHFAVMDVLGTVMKNEARTLFSAIFIMVILVILSAAGIYVVERNHQPEVFGSIPSAMWWATVTLTTVGYGDVVPQTVYGRIFGVFITVLGVGMAALPAGIIASGFTSELARRREQYEITARHLLKDGEIDKKDQRTLAKKRKHLGIGISDANHLLHKVKLDSDSQTRVQIIDCPHCGKRIELDQ